MHALVLVVAVEH